MGELRACAFSGHRTLPTEALGTLRNLLDRAIAYAYTQGCREFYNGGAIGFDTEAAERVLLFRKSHPDVRLILLLPCKNQDERWSLTQKLRYKSMIKGADALSQKRTVPSPRTAPNADRLLSSSFTSFQSSKPADTSPFSETADTVPS